MSDTGQHEAISETSEKARSAQDVEGLPVKRYRHFDGMAWPNPHALEGLAHRLVWSPASITLGDMALLSSVVCAYRQMIADPRKKREYVCRQLRNPIEQQPSEAPHEPR